MNPADYILPPEQVQARFPVEMLNTDVFRLIVSACANKLGIGEFDRVDFSVSNATGNDFRSGMATLTVSPTPKPLVRIEKIRSC